MTRAENDFNPIRNLGRMREVTTTYRNYEILRYRRRSCLSRPLNRARRLTRHVINHAVHAFHLVDDARRDHP
jgi:hypothetical protein